LPSRAQVAVANVAEILFLLFLLIVLP